MVTARETRARDAKLSRGPERNRARARVEEQQAHAFDRATDTKVRGVRQALVAGRVEVVDGRFHRGFGRAVSVDQADIARPVRAPRGAAPRGEALGNHRFTAEADES